MKPEHFKEAEGWPTLGPTYFSARDFSQTLMTKFEGAEFKPLIDKFSRQFAEKLWESVESSLMSNTEANVQGHIWRDVEAIVEAILGGEQWIMQCYVLPDRINCEAIRATLVAMLPPEVQDKRIADLETKIRNLESDLKFYRSNR